MSAAKAYKTDDGTWVVADGCWLPGVYADEQTALRAAELGTETLTALNERISHVRGENRPITAKDLPTRA
jgi:uridylate kinase